MGVRVRPSAVCGLSVCPPGVEFEGGEAWVCACGSCGIVTVLWSLGTQLRTVWCALCVVCLVCEDLDES